jgi:hypothetical protein
MAYSFNTIVASGSSATIPVTFGYIDKTHVHVTINTVEVDDADLTWDNDSLLRLPSNPIAGSVVKAYRDTPKDDLQVLFETTGIFEGDKLNLVNTQLLYIAQEAYDQGFLPQQELDAAIAYVNQTAQASQASADDAQLKLTACLAAVTAAEAAQAIAEAAAAAAGEISEFDPDAYLRVANALSELSASAATARSNIGAAAAADVISTTVRYDAAQSLDSTQKGQARSNIGAFSSGGGSIAGDTDITGTFKVVGLGQLWGFSSDNAKAKLELKSDGTRYLTYGVGGDYYSFNGAHVYSAAGRLLGTSDASSIVSGVRLAYGFELSPAGPGSSTDGRDYGAGALLSGLYISWASGNIAAGVVQRFRYLQYNIAGTWYTAAYV